MNNIGNTSESRGEETKAEKRKRSTKPLRKGAVRGSVRATVRVEGPFSLAPFELGVPLWADGDRHIWTEIPEGFEGCVFTQFDSRHQSFTEFEVRSGGYVFLAVTSRWGGGGSISANLAGEMISESAFLEEGWTKVASPGEADGDSRHGHHWVIYQRFCNKGERFRLRTEKYCAPILFF